MNQKEAYEQGKANGYSAASYLGAEAIQIASEDLGYGDPDFLDKEELEEVAESAAWEGEQNARQYSSFAGFAAEINNGPESRFEGLWDKYEEGVTVGVKKGVREWLKGQTKSNPDDRDAFIEPWYVWAKAKPKLTKAEDALKDTARYLESQGMSGEIVDLVEDALSMVGKALQGMKRNG